MAIQVGSVAPPVDGVEIRGPHALVFYKVTCSTTQLAGPPISRLGDAYPGAVAGVGQDPPEALSVFATTYGWRFPHVPDLAPYAASDGYGIVSAPTVVVIDGEGLRRGRGGVVGPRGDQPCVIDAGCSVARGAGDPL